jgi:hypothetical protein
MNKSPKLLVLCVALLLIASMGAFAKQDVEPHKFHVALNPFSWIWGAYRAEVGMPITGLLEVAGQIEYLDREVVVDMFEFPWDTYQKRLTIGPVVRLFPALNNSGFFISGRLMYMNLTVVTLGVEEGPFNDVTAGVDIGYRYKWDFPGHWGMNIQAYYGIERYFFNGEISDLINFPLLLVGGFHIGFHYR